MTNQFTRNNQPDLNRLTKVFIRLLSPGPECKNAFRILRNAVAEGWDYKRVKLAWDEGETDDAAFLQSFSDRENAALKRQMELLRDRLNSATEELVELQERNAKMKQHGVRREIADEILALRVAAQRSLTQNQRKIILGMSSLGECSIPQLAFVVLKKKRDENENLADALDGLKARGLILKRTLSAAERQSGKFGSAQIAFQLSDVGKKIVENISA